MEIIPKTDEEYFSVRYGCIRFIDSCNFLSCSLDKLIKTFVDNSQKTLKIFEEQIVDEDEILNTVIEIKTSIEEDK